MSLKKLFSLPGLGLLILLWCQVLSVNANYYAVLGVERGATQEKIKKAYRQMAFKYHPDRNMNNPRIAEEKFKEIQEAWQVLGNPTKREEYDRLGHHAYFHRSSTRARREGDVPRRGRGDPDIIDVIDGMYESCGDIFPTSAV